MSAFQPDLPAPLVDQRLRTALAELQNAERSAVLWFGEMLGRRLYRDLGFSSVYQYADLRLGFSRSKTAQFIRLCRSLRELPVLRESVARGEVPWTRAREVVAVATPRTERRWVEEAKKNGRRELVRKVRRTRARAKARRHGVAGLFPEATNTIEGRGPGTLTAPEPVEVPVGVALRFSPDQYARYEALLEKARKRGVKATREQLFLDALEQWVFGEPGKNGRNGSGTGRVRAGTTARSGAGKAGRAGEVARAAARVAAGGEVGSTMYTRVHTPFQVVVQQCDRCSRATVSTSRGEHLIHPRTLKRILCDARVRRKGERNTATIPPRVRREVLERDRFRCRAVGCGSARFLEVHHLEPRATGGRNLAENLISLCAGCHAALHKK